MTNLTPALSPPASPPSDDAVERVASSMCDAESQPGEYERHKTQGRWGNVEQWQRRARAAISAMPASDEKLREALRDAHEAYAKDQGGWHNIDDTCEQAAATLRTLSADLAAARAERDEARKNLDLARQDGHHDGYADGCKAVYPLTDNLQRQLDEAMAILTETITLYGREGGPWNIPSDPSGWIDRARSFLASIQSKEQPDV